MNTYVVRGLYTISFEKEVEAESYDEAVQLGYDTEILTEWTGNSVFVRDETRLSADGTVFDIEAELIDGEEPGDDDEE